MIMVTEKGLKKDPELPTKIDRAVFPGLQGGPHDNVTAAIAQVLYEDAQPAFKKYAKCVVENAQVLAQTLMDGDLTLVSGGTDSHLMLIDLRPLGLSGNVAAEALEVAGIIVNRNSVPGDASPFYPSGIRLGTPAVTTRGMREREMVKIGRWVVKVVGHVKDEKLPPKPEERMEFLKRFRVRIRKDKFLVGIAGETQKLCQKFPIHFN